MFIEKIDPAIPQYYQYYIVLGQPDGSFDSDTFEPQIYSPNTWSSRAILADINEDGHSDFVYFAFPTGGAHATTLQMLAGNGDGTFSPTPQTILRGLFSGYLIRVGSRGISAAVFLLSPN